MRKALVLFMLTAAVSAAAKDLPLDRLFASPSLSGPSPRLPKLSPDGTLVTLLRNRPDDRDRYDLWAIDTRTGAARMLVDSARIGTGAAISEAEKMRRERARIAGTKGITDYGWAPDGRTILVPIDGDLYLAGRDGNVRRLTETPATEIDAKVSSTGRYVSFVRDQNLFVADVGSGGERQLTSDGSGTLSWGVAEFVAQEEMDRSTGYWWSPDDRYLAVARVDESPVGIVTRAAIGAEDTRLVEQRYPAAGTKNAIVDLYIMAPDGSHRVKADLGADPDVYLARVDWAEDSQSLIVQRMSRDQKRLDVLRLDPVTGRSTLLFTETSPTWVNLHDNLKPLKDGSLIWSSERTGFAHLYRWKAGKFTQLTHGSWPVDKLVGVDQAARRIYFTATAETPLERHLYQVSYDRPGKPVRLTQVGWTNEARMDERATRALVTRSSPSQPPQVYLADARGRRLAWVEENRLDGSHPYTPYLDSHVLPEFGTLRAADGTDLHYYLLSPKREPGKRYPVLVDVYGGPGAQRVSRAWTSAAYQQLVDQGWILFMLDNRGTSRRGAKFESAIYRSLGGVEVEDQLAGVDWLKQQSFVDPARIGVSGWSYGGYMVLKLLEKAPGAFAAGIAGAPVTRWELYDTFYTERYLGNPTLDDQPYQTSNALAQASSITDPLLIIHGMADDNVVFENTTALIAKLQREKKPFEFMAYPGGAHAIAGEGPLTHRWDTMLRFLDRTVKNR